MPKLALLDGHSLAYRAFYALPADMATSSGQVTNAVYGFTAMLIKLIADEAPDAVAVAWDVRGPSFRREAYAEYKAQREAPPGLFASQLPLIHEVLEALRVHQIGVAGVEADDVIATVASRAHEEGWDVVVVTGDRDAFQLVASDIRVLYTRRGISDTVHATPEWIEERYGITPERYVDYAALRGDTSDNLPGVPGVGEKTAARLVAEYGSVESILEHLEEQTPRLRDNLGAARDQILLNKRLMSLVRDAPVRGDQVVVGEPIDDLDGLRSQPWDRSEVRRVFDGLAFRVLWDRLLEVGGEVVSASGEVVDVEVRTEMDPDQLAELGRQPEIVLEAVRHDGELAGMIVLGVDRPVFVPVARLEPLRGALADPGVGKAGHDVKPLVRDLLAMGFDFAGLRFDTALAAYIVNPAQRVADLRTLASRELGIEVEPAEEEELPDGTKASQGAFDFEETGPDIDAAARRAVAVARLVEPLIAQIDARGGLDLFREIELPLVRILAGMENAGIAIDREYLTALGGELRERLATLETTIHEAAGHPFNVNSTLQLREVLFDELQLPVLKRTPKGAPSTDATVLGKLAEEHPLVARLMEYRELEKLRSTYVDALLPLIEEDGRIRGRFNQMAAATGRLSAERPNLQNIPIRSEEGRAIRRAFVAEPGARFLVADYSQIELRILAHLSGDPGLIEAFRLGQDIHQATAARVFNVPPEEVSLDMRRRAKVINFGLLYGMEAFGLAQRLEISREEAAAQIEAYFAQFTEVERFLKGIVADAHATGFTTTLLGRRRYLPELQSSNFRDRQAGERMALNAPIQGTAADIIKKAMVELDAELASGGHRGQMLLQVHDELVLEVPEDEFEVVSRITRSVMEGIIDLDVPLDVDLASGADLAECKG